MNRTLLFAKRNIKELSRDVLSYIFCIAFPVVMLIIMSVLNASIPKEAGMTTFRIDNLSGGIIVFGQTFVMLFTAMLVATDKGTSFLMRLYATPMKSRHFTHGYIIPMLAVSIAQSLVAIISSVVISGISGVAGSSTLSVSSKSTPSFSTTVSNCENGLFTNSFISASGTKVILS